MARKDSDIKMTPAMKQFHHFKQQHPDCVLFFRMGDFYEMFYEDAKLAHKVLGVTLTQRTQGVPMAGVPYHAVEGYLHRMIRAGYRVAVCDQVEDASKAKGVVRRDVTRVVTAGTLTDEALLDEGKDNPLAAVCFGAHEQAACAWVELSTGLFHLATFQADQLEDELARLAPSELLYVQTATEQVPERIEHLAKGLGCALTARPGWQFHLDEAAQTLCKQYQVATLEGFGFESRDPALGPGAAILHYLMETQHRQTPGQDTAHLAGRLRHLQPPKRFERHHYLVIDQVSLRSLEIEKTLHAQATQGSLLAAMQNCVTAMGKRKLRQWLCYPLCDLNAIHQRQKLVGALVNDSLFLEQLKQTLDDIADIQRIVSRISVGRASPRDLVALGQSAAQTQALTQLLEQRPSVCHYHQQIQEIQEPLKKLSEQLNAACVPTPPAHLRQGGLIQDGYDAQLDEYRLLQRDSQTWLAQYQKQLIQETDIPTLKIGFNRVFGYYIEVSTTHRDKVPQAWSRKQTLKNAERFITESLKNYEGKVLQADHHAITREQTLFEELCDLAQQHLHALQTFADLVADLDVLGCFAQQAVRHHYVQPTLVQEPVLQLKNARHPVLDQLLGDQFVPNDVALGEQDATLALITGPNMAGKSTYIRQTALIVLLAHTGSFVPADDATIGLCDRIFTRIGASDQLHAGQSTFMVEMTETAGICHHATDRSLVILDEIGRGTSTLDGLSLAWAIAEYLAARKCRTLFATHYHEITHLAEQFPQVTNLKVTVREWQDQIVFLHRIVPGATDRSFGTHVAKIAGLPGSIIERANSLMQKLAVTTPGSLPPGTTGTPGTPGTPGSIAPGSPPGSVLPETPSPPENPFGNTHGSNSKNASAPGRQVDPQLHLFTEYVAHPAMEKLRQAALEQMTPMQAFDLLRALQMELNNPHA